MSGYHPDDRQLADDYGDDFPAHNNITIGGRLPSDMVPAPSKLPIVINMCFSSLKNSA